MKTTKKKSRQTDGRLNRFKLMSSCATHNKIIIYYYLEVKTHMDIPVGISLKPNQEFYNTLTETRCYPPPPILQRRAEYVRKVA